MSLASRIRAALGVQQRTTVSSLTSYGQQGWQITTGATPSRYESTGRSVRVRGFEQQATVNACVRIIADIPGSVPLQVYSLGADDEKIPSGRKHPLQVLLDNPRVGMSAQRLRQLLTAHLVTYGNGFVVLERATPKSPPFALRLINPEWIRYVYRDRETLLPIVYEWADEFGILHSSLWTDIVHLRDLTLDDPIFGFPRLASALLDIATDGEASQYVRQIITNHGQPGLIVQLDTVVTQEQARIAEERFDEKMNARGGRGKTVFWPGVQKVERLGFDLTQLEFPALRAIAREDICAAAGVDPRMIGIASAKGKDGGLSGEQYKEARQRLYLQTCGPLMHLIESELDAMLAPEFGDVYVRFSPDGISEITEDMTQTSTRVIAEVLAGIRSLESAREAIGIEQPKPTDVLMVASTSTPRTVAQVEKDAGTDTPDPIDMATALAAAKQPALPPGDAPTDTAVPRSRVLSKRHVLTEAHKDALWRSFDARGVSEEGDYHAAAIGLFAVERADFMAAMRKASSAMRSEPDTETDVPDEAAIDKLIAWTLATYAINGGASALWRSRFSKLIRSTIDQSGAELSASMGVSWNLSNPRVLNAIAQRAEALAQHVTQTTGEQITALLQTARQSGMGIRATAQLINDAVFEGQNETRATLIARTESVGALNRGEYEAARASGVVQAKSWLSKRDPKVRDTHYKADGEGRIPLDGHFQSNSLQYPGDPSGGPEEICNCRCTLLYHTEPANEGERAAPTPVVVNLTVEAPKGGTSRRVTMTRPNGEVVSANITEGEA